MVPASIVKIINDGGSYDDYVKELGRCNQERAERDEDCVSLREVRKLTAAKAQRELDAHMKAFDKFLENIQPDSEKREGLRRSISVSHSEKTRSFQI